MRRCPKCSLTSNDSSQICRSCGAILDDVSDEREVVDAAVASFDDGATEDANRKELAHEPGWTCPECNEFIPDTFDVCWNCNHSRSDDAESSAEPHTEQEVEVAEDVQQPDHIYTGRCASCGSTRIIPDAQVIDQGQHSSGSLSVVVYGDLDALIFKDRLFGTLKADICGDCGHVQMRVQNPAELYEHYRQSQQ